METGKKRHSIYQKDHRFFHQKIVRGHALVDLVLVILDGGSGVLGASYELINQITIFDLENDKEKRAFVAINQCDMEIKTILESQKNNPEIELQAFFQKKY